MTVLSSLMNLKGYAITGAACLIIGASLMKYEDTIHNLKKEEKVQVASAEVMQAATDHVASADELQTRTQQAIVTQLLKDKANTNAKLQSLQAQLRSSTDALAISTNGLRILAAGGGNSTSASEAAATATLNKVRAELDRFNESALAIASKGDECIVERNSLIDTYNSAASAVNGK